MALSCYPKACTHIALKELSLAARDAETVANVCEAFEYGIGSAYAFHAMAFETETCNLYLECIQWQFCVNISWCSKHKCNLLISFSSIRAHFFLVHTRSPSRYIEGLRAIFALAIKQNEKSLKSFIIKRLSE